MAQKFEFHLFLCLGEDTLDKLIRDIDSALLHKEEIKLMIPNYNFKGLGILKKRLLRYKDEYSKLDVESEKIKVLEKIKQAIDISTDMKK